MTRDLKARLIALLVVVVLGLYYIVFDAVGIKLTNGPYTIHVDLANAGSIYPDASVTFRGVAVGKITSIHLHPDMVVADLAINHGVKIPANVTASVKELTAASEQYMDLVPPVVDPPYLTSGATIPIGRTTLPVTVGTLLNSVNSLVNSLHASDLNTISHAFGIGLENAGGDLRSIIVDSRVLLDALEAAQTGTIQAIDSGHTVLSTLNSTSGEFAQFSHNLNLLTQQIAQSNSDLMKLINNGASASGALTQFLTANGTDTISLINNLGAVVGLTAQREPAFRALVQILPIFANNIASTASGGNLRFELTFNDRNTVCPYAHPLSEPTAIVAAADTTGSCTVELPDLLQRGADKAPAPIGG
jgi:phospholipid/cholesterol/gamma-HCH transport system substrate-binding protein